jgi:hypothetical protein
MAHHDTGPRRSSSPDSYVRQTRIIGAAAALVLIGAVVSDRVNTGFWDHHTLLADLVVSLIIVGLTVAVVNEALERGQRRRWSVLAQYVLFQLARHARITWTELTELVGLMPSGEDTERSLDEGARSVHDTAHLVGAVRELLGDDQQRQRLRDLMDRLIAAGDELLGRWASVMLNSSMYAEIIDRHVELYSRMAWVRSLLNYLEPDADADQQRLKRSTPTPTATLQRDLDSDTLADYLAGIIQLAEGLDRGTLQLALRIVPPAWWATRLSVTTNNRG